MSSHISANKAGITPAEMTTSQILNKAAKVPAAALLRMLAENDRLGNGKFFAYDRLNRRFLMQRVILNRGITPETLRGVFEDMAKGVIGSHSTWSVARWAEQPAVKQSTLPLAPPAERRR